MRQDDRLARCTVVSVPDSGAIDRGYAYVIPFGANSYIMNMNGCTRVMNAKLIFEYIHINKPRDIYIYVCTKTTRGQEYGFDEFDTAFEILQSQFPAERRNILQININKTYH